MELQTSIFLTIIGMITTLSFLLYVLNLKLIRLVEFYKKRSNILQDRRKKLFVRIFNLSDNNKELRKSFIDAVAEIKKMVAENKLLESINENNLKQIEYLKAVKNHKKRPIFEPEVKEWECILDDDYYPNFKQEKIYKATTPHANINKETTLCLVSERGIPCLVDKKYFKPIKI